MTEIKLYGVSLTKSQIENIEEMLDICSIEGHLIYDDPAFSALVTLKALLHKINSEEPKNREDYV